MPLTHALLPMAARSSVETGAAVPLAGRTRWSVTLRVGAVEPGGSLTVTLEGSATGADDTWDALASFPAQVAASTATLSTTSDPVGFALQGWHRVLRARATAQTGAVTYEVDATARFVDATLDTVLFNKELRSFGDGFSRLVQRAEDEVLLALTRPERARLSLPTPLGGEPLSIWHPAIVEGMTLADAERLADQIDALALDLDLTLPGAGDALRGAIVRQAEHLHRRFELERSGTPTALVTLREMPMLAPGVDRWLAPYRPQRASVWRGR